MGWFPFPGHTERSWLWDGTTPGDASFAPYKKAMFNDWFVAALCNVDSTVGHVVPGYLQDLDLHIDPTNPNILLVRPGAALIDNYIYENTGNVYFTAQPLNAAGTIRFDSIILRVDNDPTSKNYQKVCLAYELGVEETSFIYVRPYAVQQTRTVWEIELWRFEITSDDPLLLEITQDNIMDMRAFLPTFSKKENNPINLVQNSEFMAFSKPGNTQPNHAPEYWDNIVVSASYATTANAAALAPMKRGRAVSVTTTAVGQGIMQRLIIPELPDGSGRYKTFTVEGLIQLSGADDKARITLTPKQWRAPYIYEEVGDPLTIFVDGRTTTVQHVRRTMTLDIEENHEIYEVDLEIKGVTASDTILVGQFFVSPGYFTGGLRPIHETIVFAGHVADGTWDGDAKSTATTNHDLSNTAQWSGRILPQTRGLFVSFMCRDSGSAAAASAYLRLKSYPIGTTYGEIELMGIANDGIINTHRYIPVDEYLRKNQNSAPYMQLETLATGAGTLDCWVELVGIVI